MATLGPLCFVRCPQSLFAPAVTALALYLDLYWKIEFMAFLWFCNWIIFPLQTTVSFVTNSFNRPQLLKDLLLQGLQKDTVLAGNPRQWDQFITEIGVGLGWACERSWHQGRLKAEEARPSVSDTSDGEITSLCCGYVKTLNQLLPLTETQEILNLMIWVPISMVPFVLIFPLLPHKGI